MPFHQSSDAFSREFRTALAEKIEEDRFTTLVKHHHLREKPNRAAEPLKTGRNRNTASARLRVDWGVIARERGE